MNINLYTEQDARSSQNHQIIEAVRARYGATAAHVLSGSSCCGDICCGDNATNPIAIGLYAMAEPDGLPVQATLASLGGGNPTALAEQHPGELVLDLGSGGIDVWLSARRVGPSGFVYGLAMTDELLDLARRNVAASGVETIELLKGDIAALPLPDNSVDVDQLELHDQSRR